MSEMSALATQKDLAINHNRDVSHRVLQRLAEAVASVVQIKEETWSYTVPKKPMGSDWIDFNCFSFKIFFGKSIQSDPID